jgi:GT2 family glycosyltransferase
MEKTIKASIIENENLNPLISIITVNFNHNEYTLLMLRSLKKCTYKNIEIIVVDNASYVDNLSEIEDEFPEAKLVRLSNNLGFAGGNNEGLKYATGDYILLLNNDTEVDPGFLEPLIETFRTNSDAGIVSPRLMYFYSPDMNTIQYAGTTPINLKTGRNKSIGNNEIDRGQYNYVCKTAYANGAALMFSRKMLETVGCMPDVYFLYYEELDWCVAAQKKGFNIYYAGTSKVYHKGSITVGVNGPIRKYYMARNRILFLRRNADLFTLVISMVFFFSVSYPIAHYRMIKNKEVGLLKYFIRGVFWNFTHFKGVKAFPQIHFSENKIPELTNVSSHFKENSQFIDNIKK